MESQAGKVAYSAERRLGGEHLAPEGHLLLGHIDVELTERCNNHCIHCYINLPERDAAAQAAEMDTAFVQDVLRQAADLGCLTVRFTGGEPLLRADFEELYLFARRLGMRVILFTNARRITPHLAQLLARIPPRRPVEVSVYGMHPHSYDAVAGVSGAFEECRRGIELLSTHRVPFVLKTCALPPNRQEIEEMGAWAAALTGGQSALALTAAFDLRARRDNPAKNRRIERLRVSPERIVELLALNPHYREGMREFCAKFVRPPGDRLFACGMGQSVSVDAYGRAQGCLLLRHPEAVYDLRSGSLRQALAEFFPRLRQRRAANPEYLRRCARCFLKGLCQQCPAKAWMEHGVLDTPVEYFCEVAHAEARYLGLLAEGQRAWEVLDWRLRLENFAGELATAPQAC